MFQEAIQELFEQHRLRLEASMDKPEDTLRIAQAFADLDLKELGPRHIDRVCTEELKMVLTKQYEKPIGSTRLLGHGWTTAHILDHMKRFLEAKLTAAGHHLRQLCANQEEPQAEQELFFELDTLEE